MHLRILNLAGNDITSVTGLGHLHSLEEINLRRNRVSQVVSNIAFHPVSTLLMNLFFFSLVRNRRNSKFDSPVPQSQSHSKASSNFADIIHSFNLSLCVCSFEDAPAICKCEHLKELTLDSNPLALLSDYRYSVISHVPNLQYIDQVEITVRSNVYHVICSTKLSCCSGK